MVVWVETAAEVSVAAAGLPGGGWNRRC